MIGRRKRHVLYPEGYTGPICPKCTHPLEETDHPRKGFHCPHCKIYFYSKPRKKGKMHIQPQGGDLSPILRKQKSAFFDQPYKAPKKGPEKKGKGVVLALTIIGLLPFLYWLAGEIFTK